MPEEKQMNYIVSTLAIEDLTASDTALRLCREMDQGTLSIEEALEKILSYHGIRKGT